MATRRLPAEERKRLILIAAIRVFASRGLHGATTREIAAEAGVAEALLYRYFAGKQELFLEAMLTTAQRLAHSVEDIFSRHRDHPTDAIAELVTFYRTMVERHEDFAKMVFVISAEFDNPQIRNAYIPYQERVLNTIEQSLRHWQATGLITPGLPPRAIAWLLLGSFQAIALMKQTGQLGELHIDPAIRVVQSFLNQKVQPTS